MILAFLAILKSKKSNFNRKSGFLTSSFSDMNDKRKSVLISVMFLTKN